MTREGFIMRLHLSAIVFALSALGLVACQSPQDQTAPNTLVAVKAAAARRQAPDHDLGRRGQFWCQAR